MDVNFLCTGIYTAFKTFLHKDKILIKRLLKVKTLLWSIFIDLKMIDDEMLEPVSPGDSKEKTFRGSERDLKETSVRAHS